MKIYRVVGGSRWALTLTPKELKKAHEAQELINRINDAKAQVERTNPILARALHESDYEFIAKDFMENYDRNRAENDMWKSLINNYKSEHLKNVYASTSWGTILISTVEGCLELLDEFEELISSTELDSMSDTEVASLFKKCRDALLDSDEAYANIVYEVSPNVVAFDKCVNGRYERAVERNGEENVKQIGEYFVVVKD